MKASMFTLVIHYYNNIRAINDHFDRFSRYSDGALEGFELLLVDDCSHPEQRVDFDSLVDKHRLRKLRFRVLAVDQDIQWNQAGARNLGCFQARTDWLFCTDVDHFVGEECVLGLNEHLKAGLDERVFYRVKRRDVASQEIVKPHTNTFLINRKSFMQMGGYDEDFAGGAGHSDQYFQHLWALTGNGTAVFDDVFVDVDRTAATQELDRDLERNRSLYQKKISRLIPERQQRINFDWRQVYPRPADAAAAHTGRIAPPSETGMPLTAPAVSRYNRAFRPAWLLNDLVPAARKPRMRIGKLPWHTGHDYELCKLPADFLIAGDTSRAWATTHRPVPKNVTFVAQEALRDADLIILHIDQWTLSELDKRLLFKRTADIPGVPKVVLNHGCNMVDGCSSEEMRDFIGDYPVVCNSRTAHDLWNLPRSRYITHGMTPAEWPATNYGRQNIVLTQSPGERHELYRNNAAALAFEQKTGHRLDWIGRDQKFSSFDRYRAFLATSSIYFNPSYASPNPRARTEAMLCGLVPVTTNSHGEDGFITNGVNGFCSNDMEQLYEWLLLLRSRPDLCRDMGQQARKAAQHVFHIDKFVAQWSDVVADVLGRSFEAAA